MSSGRMFRPGDIHLVTNRCFQERLLLLPNEQVNFIIGYWLARSLKRYGTGIQLFAFIFLSNHFHFLLRDNEGNLCRFMGYFLANVAKAVNASLKRSGTFWQGHYDDQIIVGDDTLSEKYAYVLCNAVKAGLVDKAEEWIGFNSLEKALRGGTYRFTALNVNRYNKACRNRKKKPSREQFMETYEFSLTALPGFEKKRIKEQASYLSPMIAKQEAFHRAMRGDKPPLGIETISEQKATDRPIHPSKSPRKRFACKDKGQLVTRVYRRVRGEVDFEIIAGDSNRARIGNAHLELNRIACLDRRRAGGKWTGAEVPVRPIDGDDRVARFGVIRLVRFKDSVQVVCHRNQEESTGCLGR